MARTHRFIELAGEINTAMPDTWRSAPRKPSTLTKSLRASKILILGWPISLTSMTNGIALNSLMNGSSD